jgi:hypothetical protein
VFLKNGSQLSRHLIKEGEQHTYHALKLLRLANHLLLSLIGPDEKDTAAQWTRAQDSGEVCAVACRLCPALSTLEVEVVVAFRLEKTLRSNLFKADGALTMVAMPVAPGTVLAGGAGQRKTLAARHFV